MRVLLAVLILALSLGYSFRVEDVFDIFKAGINILPKNGMIMDPKIGVECCQNIDPAEDFVDTDRQGDSLSDNIPAVFAVTFGASLLANVLFRGGGDASANDVPSQGIDICQQGQGLAKLTIFD